MIYVDYDKDGDVLYIKGDKEQVCKTHKESNYDYELVWRINDSDNICGTILLGLSILQRDLSARDYFWKNPDWKDVPEWLLNEIEKHVGR